MVSPGPLPPPPTATLPYVFLNVATSADGKIAPANRRFEPFGSATDRSLLLELRSRADAVMSGARTIDSLPVTMGPGGPLYRKKRLKLGLAEYNIRVIVSGSASISPGAEIFRHRFSPIVVLVTERASKSRLKALRALGAEIEICGDAKIDFRLALRQLRKRWNVRWLLCEGGGAVNGALFEARLVHRLYQTLCPLIIGGRSAPTPSDSRANWRLDEAVQLKRASSELTSGEMYLCYDVV